MYNLTVSDWLGLMAFLSIIVAGLWVGVMCVVDIVRCTVDGE